KRDTSFATPGYLIFGFLKISLSVVIPVVKGIFTAILSAGQIQQTPVCQGLPAFRYCPSWMVPVRSQTKRDTSFATPGYGFCYDHVL
ncbi:MAG: hypothetical protein RSG55_04745, partial [Oscillospiraceae bacterium]